MERTKYLFICVVLSVLTPYARALDPSRTIKQFDHSTWGTRQGAPGGIAALAQTSDGFLWLGTANGLVRFDGVTFERVHPSSGPSFPQDDITALSATGDGGLWVGYRLGGVSFLKDGVLTNYPFPEGTVWDFEYAPDGVLWMSGGFRGSLARLEKGVWRSVGLSLGYTESFAFKLMFDSSGDLWVGGIQTLWVLPHGATRIEKTEAVSNDITKIARSPDGSLWWADEKGVLPLSKHYAGAIEHKDYLFLGARSGGLLVDRDGTLWCFAHDGVLRVSTPSAILKLHPPERANAVQHFTAAEGLSQGDVIATIEDQEGNIWSATAVSLDRFRMTTFSPALPGKATASGYSMVPQPNGRLVVSSGDTDLTLLHDGLVSTIATPRNESFDSLYTSPEGTIWAGGKGRLAYLRDRRYIMVALPRSFEDNPRNTQAMTSGPDGSLWLSTIGRSPFRLKGTRWTEIPPLEGFPKTPVCLYTDVHGRIWAGYTDGKVAVYAESTVHTYSPTDGITIGNVMAIYGKESNIWLAGQHGVDLFRNGHFFDLHFDGGIHVDGITGIVQGEDGSLWLNGIAGIVRISAKELSLFIASPDHPLKATIYNYLDGLDGAAKQLRPVSSACRGTDGRLWFALERNVVSVNPLNPYQDTHPPPVIIIRTKSDLGQQEGGDVVHLAKTSKGIEIDFTAPSLSIPERVKFKYNLDNGPYQEVGSARQAFLTGLTPGTHRFRVIASNGYGVWNLTGATIIIVRPPLFSETVWFKLLFLVASVLLLTALYLIRMRQVIAKSQMRMSERLRERERIARDLHDTLLQGFQGVLLRFQTIAKRSGDGTSLREMKDTILRADSVLEEARDKVWQLRSASRPSDDLASNLNAVAQELRSQWEVEFSLQIIGTPRPMLAAAFDEIYPLAREAIVNAFRHSFATAIAVELKFGQTEFRIRVWDNGRGLPDKAWDRQDDTKHWGLLGMQERAKKLGGRLIWSLPNVHGTEMQLILPAAVVYNDLSYRWKHFVKRE